MNGGCNISCQLTLYGIHLLQTKIRNGVEMKDVIATLYTIPKKKYDAPIFATVEDLEEELRRLEQEEYVEITGGKYRLTERGRRVAEEVAKANVRYMGHMRKIVAKSVKLYTRLELLIFE